jgi:hypothetical protein
MRRLIGIVCIGLAVAFVPAAGALTQQQKLTAPDGFTSDNFGWSVAISGDTAIVGAPFDDVGANANQGSAYVFVRSGGVWTLQVKLVAANGDADDSFGNSVAIDGDTAVVGAPDDEVGANHLQGTAYVFVRSGTTWTQQAQLIANNGDANDRFGAAVAIDGDTALVGAPRDEVGANFFQGTAYVFTRSGTTWTQQAQLIQSNGDAGDQFGAAVAIDGDTAVVGAPDDEVGANTFQGTAYVFVRSGPVWSEQAQLAANNGDAGDLFGAAVAVSGDTALAGAANDEVGANADQGTAYVFVRSGSFWIQQAQLIQRNGAGGDRFGSSVALQADTALLGAPYRNSSIGSAYVFSRSGSSWTEQQNVFAPDGGVGDYFGSVVALDAGTAVVGAPAQNISYIDQGSAYVFASPPTALAATALSARRSRAGVVLRWRGADPTVLGYRVYRGRMLLTPRLVTRTRTGTYRYVDRSAPHGSVRYRVQAVRTDGSTTWAGSART